AYNRRLFVVKLLIMLEGEWQMTTVQHMTTYSGKEFNPLQPNKADILTVDIAHALSMICRANGHCRNFYSVAQHSINCAKEAEKRNYSPKVQLGALLHDASEAYISDIIRPVKAQLENYQEIEANLQTTIYDAYGIGNLSETELQLIAEIDDAMLAYEMNVLMNVKVKHKNELIGDYELN